MKFRVALAIALAVAFIHRGHAQNAVLPKIVLLSAAAVSGPQLTWIGGQGVFECFGVWNGATVTLVYVNADASTTPLGAGTTLTSASSPPNGSFVLGRQLVQVLVTGAGGSTSLTCTAFSVPSVVQ
jgi:hypothetical protein